MIQTQPHLPNFVCHFVSVWGSQGYVEDYDTVHHYHGGHRHHKHKIPAVKCSYHFQHKPKTLSQNLKVSCLLSNKRHRLRSLWNLLSNEEEEHSLAQKSHNRHGALLTTSCKTKTSTHSGWCSFDLMYASTARSSLYCHDHRSKYE